MQSESVGVVGLGLLGGALARRLKDRGVCVVGYDTNSNQRALAAAENITVVDTLAEIFNACDRILLSLPNGDVVRAVLESSVPHLRRGQTVIDTTTAAPEQMIGHAELLSRHQVAFVEAEVAGSSAQAARGEVLVFAAGDERNLAAVSDVLAAFAAEVHYVGPHGNAAKVKLVHNLVLGLHRAVLAEGWSLAKALGLDALKVLKLLQRSPAASVVMQTKGAKMAARDFTPQATVRQHLKDVRLMLAAGEQAEVDLPLTAIHRLLLERVEGAGLGDLDNSAVIEAWSLPDP